MVVQPRKVHEMLLPSEKTATRRRFAALTGTHLGFKHKAFIFVGAEDLVGLIDFHSLLPDGNAGFLSLDNRSRDPK